MRILITGGAGFVGSHLVKAFRDRHHEVHNFDINAVKESHGDVRKIGDLLLKMNAFKPEVVLHYAAQISVPLSLNDPIGTFSVNFFGTMNVLQVAAMTGVKHVIMASSGGAIYPYNLRGCDEGDTPTPSNPYGYSKLYSEQQASLYTRDGMIVTCLRFANIYGNGGKGVVSVFIDRILGGEPVEMYSCRNLDDDGCIRDYVFIDDVVELNVKIVEEGIEAPQYYQNNVGIINVGTGVGTTTKQLLMILRALVGKGFEIKSMLPRPGDVAASILIARQFERILDRKPTSIQEGLKKVLERAYGQTAEA